MKALARAHRWQRMLDEGRHASISEMAAAERIECGYLGSLLRLTLLAPDIAEAIPDERQSCGLGLLRKFDSLPTYWAERRFSLIQRRCWSGPTRSNLDRPQRSNPLFYAWRPRAGTARVDLAETAATQPARAASTHQ